ALVGFVCDHPRLVLALSLLVCAGSVLASLCCLEYHTPRNDLVSARKDYHQRWQRSLEEFVDDDDAVVVVQGEGRERMKQALDALEPGKPPSASNERFFRQLAAVARSARTSLEQPGRHDSPWGSLAGDSSREDVLAEPQYFFSGDGQLAFLLVRPVKEAGSFT